MVASGYLGSVMFGTLSPERPRNKLKINKGKYNIMLHVESVVDHVGWVSNVEMKLPSFVQTPRLQLIAGFPDLGG